MNELQMREIQEQLEAETYFSVSSFVHVGVCVRIRIG